MTAPTYSLIPVAFLQDHRLSKGDWRLYLRLRLGHGPGTIEVQATLSEIIRISGMPHALRHLARLERFGWIARQPVMEGRRRIATLYTVRGATL